MHRKFSEAKLLVTIVGEHYAELVIETIKNAGASGGTRASGRGTAFYLVPGGLPKADAPEDIVFSVIPDDAERILEAVVLEAKEDPEDLSGMAMLVDVPGIFLRSGIGVERESTLQEENGSKSMRSDITLIVCIVNHDKADDVMAVARKAGAMGGTVLNARGTGTEEDVKFFGISLAPKKEMLFVVAQGEQIKAILDAVSSLPLFSEPGGGIVFTVPVDQFVVLGR